MLKMFLFLLILIDKFASSLNNLMVPAFIASIKVRAELSSFLAAILVTHAVVGKCSAK